jgi:hypothetical protein
MLTANQLVESEEHTMQLTPRKQLLGPMIVLTVTGLAFIFGKGAVTQSIR